MIPGSLLIDDPLTNMHPATTTTTTTTHPSTPLLQQGPRAGADSRETVPVVAVVQETLQRVEAVCVREKERQRCYAEKKSSFKQSIKHIVYCSSFITSPFSILSIPTKKDRQLSDVY